MQWFYFMTLTISLVVTAKYLWKIDQVYAIAALLTGIICLIWSFLCAAAWVQLGIAGLFIGLYHFYSRRYSVDRLMNL